MALKSLCRFAAPRTHNVIDGRFPRGRRCSGMHFPCLFSGVARVFLYPRVWRKFARNHCRCAFSFFQVLRNNLLRIPHWIFCVWLSNLCYSILRSRSDIRKYHCVSFCAFHVRLSHVYILLLWRCSYSGGKLFSVLVWVYWYFKSPGNISDSRFRSVFI